MHNQAESLADLTSVGDIKLMGYLPLDTIKQRGGDVGALRETLINKGLQTFILTEELCPVTSGALCAFNQAALQKYLNWPDHQTILKTHNWPKNADEFARATLVHTAPPGKLYDLIALCYFDKRPQYRDYCAMPGGPYPWPKL
tara:strand:- start:12847 stop:13275 length:429 start_codon:yes stop_codon:yes gene_type:complete